MGILNRGEKPSIGQQYKETCQGQYRLFHNMFINYILIRTKHHESEMH